MTTLYPTWWPNHSHPHDALSCDRCLLQADWDELSLDCACLDQDWYRTNVGTLAVPDWQWVCSECCKVQGPAYTGGQS